MTDDLFTIVEGAQLRINQSTLHDGQRVLSIAVGSEHQGWRVIDLTPLVALDLATEIIHKASVLVKER